MTLAPQSKFCRYLYYVRNFNSSIELGYELGTIASAVCRAKPMQLSQRYRDFSQLHRLLSINQISTMQIMAIAGQGWVRYIIGFYEEKIEKYSKNQCSCEKAQSHPRTLLAQSLRRRALPFFFCGLPSWQPITFVRSCQSQRARNYSSQT